MIAFKDFRFAWTYDIAGWIRKLVFNQNDEDLVNVVDFYEQTRSDFYGPAKNDFIQRAVKPSKFTHLHAFVDYVLWNTTEYTLRKDGGDSIMELLTAYEISFDDMNTFARKSIAQVDSRKKDYTDYLYDLVSEHVLDQVTEEIFTILFPDRELLLRLNEIIAEMIRPLKVADHPRLLASDGVVRRCRYWPKWLQHGILHRDKGRCCLCSTDLSGLLIAGMETHIDHVVPLHLGGTNDPTNLQLLCSKCNTSKGGTRGRTSRKQFLFWDVE